MPKKRILIIDDEEGIRDILKISLEEEGYEVYEASNGLEAMKILKDIHRPNLILLDLMMPIMDGKEFVTALNRDEKLSKMGIPIVLITAFSKPQISGIKKILYKPMDLDSLLQTAKEFSL